MGFRTFDWVYHDLFREWFQPFEYTVSFDAVTDPSATAAIPGINGKAIRITGVFLNLGASAAETITIVDDGMVPVTIASFAASTAVGPHPIKFPKIGFPVQDARNVNIVASGVGYVGTLTIVGYYANAPDAIWTDDFNRSNVYPIAPNWIGFEKEYSWLGHQRLLEIIDKTLQTRYQSDGTNPGYYCYNVFGASGTLDNQRVTIDWVRQAWDFIGIGLRCDGKGNGIWVWWTYSQPDAPADDNSVTFWLASDDLETWVQVGPAVTFADIPAASLQLTVDVVGGAACSVRVYHAGSLVATQAFTGAPTEGLAAIMIGDDNWETPGYVGNILDNFELRST